MLACSAVEIAIYSGSLHCIHRGLSCFETAHIWEKQSFCSLHLWKVSVESRISLMKVSKQADEFQAVSTLVQDSYITLKD